MAGWKLLLVGVISYLIGFGLGVVYTNYRLSSQPTKRLFVGPSPSPATAVSPVKIAILSTAGWKTVSHNGVSFKIPPQAECNDDCSLISWTFEYQGRTLPTSIRLEVRDYLGGSRREQFYTTQKPECRDIYQEAMFGSVKALQIAIDGDWCQGGGGIAAVIGNKLVIVSDLFYKPDSKEINRWDIRDTLVSTLQPTSL